MQSQTWHILEIEAVLVKLQATASGLSSEVARQRLAEFGPNTIPEQRRLPLPAMLMHQLSEFMIIVLLVVACISGIVGEPQDTIAILVIVLLMPSSAPSRSIERNAVAA